MRRGRPPDLAATRRSMGMQLSKMGISGRPMGNDRASWEVTWASLPSAVAARVYDSERNILRPGRVAGKRRGRDIPADAVEKALIAARVSAPDARARGQEVAAALSFRKATEVAYQRHEKLWQSSARVSIHPAWPPWPKSELSPGEPCTCRNEQYYCRDCRLWIAPSSEGMCVSCDKVVEGGLCVAIVPHRHCEACGTSAAEGDRRRMIWPLARVNKRTFDRTVAGWACALSGGHVKKLS